MSAVVAWGNLLIAVALVLPSMVFATHSNPELKGAPQQPPAQHTDERSRADDVHLNYYGGRVVSNLQVVQVLYGDGDYAPSVVATTPPSLASFYQAVLNSRYVDWLSEYDTDVLAVDRTPGTNQKIRRGSFAGQYRIAPSAANSGGEISDAQIKAELVAQVAAGHLPAPARDIRGNPNTYYAVFLPHGVTVDLGWAPSCVFFCAYHGSIANGLNSEIYYGVHPDMQAGSGCERGCGHGQQFQRYTQVASHEMIEAITDPEVGLAHGPLGRPLAWYDPDYAEIADICRSRSGKVIGEDGIFYSVQAEWSNRAKACIVTGPCGNGVADPGEECDDGNSEAGDGCDPRCEIEPCHSCTGSPSVCDALPDSTPCDDGIFCNGAGDSCHSGACSVHSGDPCAIGPACHNVCNEEKTDCLAIDGSQCAGADPNGCMNACIGGACLAGAPVTRGVCCGNHRLDPGEGCDDGNIEANDGCGLACDFDPNLVPPFGQCPAVGIGTGCRALLNITASHRVNVLVDVQQPSYSGRDDSLVGVQNGSDQTVSDIYVNSAAPIFAFDFDGICNTFAAPLGCPFGPTRYEGPGVSFAPADRKSGVVHFASGIPPGGTAYFALEELAAWGELRAEVVACGDGIQAAGEQCDDGNHDDADACRNNCTLNSCGDGSAEVDVEQCDDGNLVDGDGCDSDCTFTACGNRIITGGEQCDDGNFVGGDGCEANCRFTAGFTPPFLECPALGAALGCHILLNVSASGAVNILRDPSAEPYNADGDDVLVGVRNNSARNVAEIALRSAQPIFAFDGNGVCSGPTAPSGCPFGASGYEGPGVWFDIDDDHAGSVNFSTPIPPAGSAYFSLETLRSGAQLSAQLRLCRDSIVDADEECDDGNLIDGDGCDSNCRSSACGNGVITGSEQCDDMNRTDGDGCNANCMLETGWRCSLPGRPCSLCGNRIVETGEQCDDGNLSNGDGCDFNCTATACGNGVRTGPEQCDDGNRRDGDGCDSNCTYTRCPNGIRTGSEECDDGNYTSGDGCDWNCRFSRCGNGAVSRDEQCDDGNSLAGDGCDANCRLEPGWRCWFQGQKCALCGNGIPEPSEQCDDGNSINGDGCDVNCMLTKCGNGIVTAGEECDDGDMDDKDGCRNDCTRPHVAFPQCPAIDASRGCGVLVKIRLRGDVRVRIDHRQSLSYRSSTLVGVQNDSPRTLYRLQLTSSLPVFDFSAHHGLCSVYVPPFGCPFGASGYEGPGTLFIARSPQVGFVYFSQGIAPGETAYFSLNDRVLRGGQLKVVVNTCGDGIPDPGEACDDGNQIDADACKNDCQLNTCGDGVFDPANEQCDDGNDNNLDDCLSDCRLNVCGDSYRNPAKEQCDDGGFVDGDGCDSNCTVTRCRNGVVTAGEECDDGNYVDADACRNDCRLNGCGDRSLNVTGEQCDDGNILDGDGCDGDCRFPDGLERPFHQCPVFRYNTACKALFEITAQGTVNVLFDMTQYNGYEFALVGVQNNWDRPITALTVHARRPVFAFNAEYGLCGSYSPAPGCPFGPTRFEGPGVSFAAADASNGSVRFAQGIPPGGTAYFGLSQYLWWGDLTAEPSQCGDGVIQPGEQCDDGNFNDGDGCDSNCTPTACGNGVRNREEQCDDGNQVSDDGCDVVCRAETGWRCRLPGVPCETVCGDGYVRGSEQCDDGNDVSGDGCDRNCTPTGCGNRIISNFELCDDGNTTGGDGCSATCDLETDAFACYDAFALGTQPPQRHAKLTNYMSYDLEADLLQVQGFCASAAVNDHPVSAAALHLQAHNLMTRDRRTLSYRLPRLDQTVTNRIGTVHLDVTWPTLFLSPVSTGLASPPPASSDGDAFTCFRVKRAKGAARFAAVKNVSVADEFGGASVTLIKPEHLCMRTNLNGADPMALRHAGSLLCYRATRQADPIGRLFTHDDLGPTAVYVRQRDEVCVPSVLW